MHFHDMEESVFKRLISCDSREQQCSESVNKMYYWFFIVELSLDCQLLEVKSMLDA